MGNGLGIAILILASLLGWWTRSAMGIAVLEVLILSVFLIETVIGKRRFWNIPTSLKFLLAGSFVSTFFSVYLHDSILGFVKLTLFILAFSITSQSLSSSKNLRLLAIVFAITGFAAGIYGIVSFFQLPNLAIGTASFFGWRNLFAGFILLTLPLLFSLFLVSKKKITTVLFGASAILLAVNLYLTFSQAAWLALLPAFFIVVVFSKKIISRKTLVTKLACFALMSILLASLLLFLHQKSHPNQGEDLAAANTVQSLSLENRFDYWKTSLQIIKHDPFLGIGLGNFKTLYTHYQQNIWSYSVSPHNIFLLLATEIGILGTLFFVLFLLKTGGLGISILRSKNFNHDPLFLSFALGIFASLVSSFLHNLVDLDWEIPSLFLLFFIEAGMLFGIKTVLESQKLEPQTSPAPDFFSSKPLISFLLFLILSVFILIPAITDLLLKKGNISQDDIGKAEKSLKPLLWARKMNPLNADIDENLAESYQLKILDHVGDRQENQYRIVKHARRAAKLDPQSSRRHRFFGEMLNFTSSAKDEQITEAEKELRRAITMNPYNEPIYYQILAGILLRQERKEEALATIDIPLKLYTPEAKAKIFQSQESRAIIERFLERVRLFQESIQQ